LRFFLLAEKDVIFVKLYFVQSVCVGFAWLSCNCKFYGVILKTWQRQHTTPHDANSNT